MGQGFRNATLARKATILSTLFIAMAVVIALAGMVAVRRMGEDLRAVTERGGPTLAYVAEAGSRLIALERTTRDHLLETTDAGREEQEARITAIRTEMLAFYDSLKAVPGQTEEIRARTDSLIAMDVQVREVRQRVFAASRAGRSAEGYRIVDAELVPVATRASEALTRLNTDVRAKLVAVKQQAASIERTMLIVLLAATLAVVAVGIVITVGVRGYIDGTVGPLLDRMQKLQGNCVTGLDRGLARMAAGDLDVQVTPTTTPVDVTGTDELGQLGTAFNGILGMVQNTVGSFARAQGAVRGLIKETESLAVAGREGRLSARGDEKAHAGAYGEVVRGFNSTLDAVIAPVNEASEVLAKVAAGDLTVRVTGNYRGDHATVKTSLNTAIDAMQSAFAQIGESAQQLAGASEELSATSSQMGSNAEDASSRTNEVAAAAEQLSRNAQSVATATEEMTASIREIAQNAAQAARVANEAVGVTQSASRSVERLSASSDQIGEVVRLITTIAEQTNLLALNATIEAARAGEAGKGFAVVAGEVKELAKATARATGDISRQVTAIQADSKQVVAAIEQISQIIGQINDIQSAIAGAVEEQSATTNEMGRNVAESAQGVNGIAESITHVARTSAETAMAAQNSHQAAQSLATLAAELQTLVAGFRLHDRAGASPREPGRYRVGGRAAVA
jgi:methyl-accepting chemotaxis protein